MSDDEKEANMMEPPSVDIPLNERVNDKSRRSSGASSASTSSFEDLNVIRLNNTRRRSGQSYHSDISDGPATVEVAQIKSPVIDTGSPSTAPASPRAMLAFKKSSIEEQPVLTHNSSPSMSPNLQSTRASTHSVSPKPNAKTKQATKTKTKTKPINMKGKKSKIPENRDPEDVNGIVKIDFEEIFAEPEGTYSFGTIWGATYRIFTDTKLWCYKFLSALCGVPCALCWGLHFACLSFCMIWYYQPSIRSFSIQVKPLQKVYGVLVHSFIEPCFAAAGKLFSSIKVHNSND
ncbi:caveolin-1-like [Ruditapes philippinarum]|uniref:caveolin-1-like n=1 Tax=Ruditapes philippinarum TaxID=129788 RepID=UPI00295BF5CA|nr:caveolin-1-like [Ruditapes philippinarum]